MCYTRTYMSFRATGLYKAQFIEQVYTSAPISESQCAQASALIHTQQLEQTTPPASDSEPVQVQATNLIQVQEHICQL